MISSETDAAAVSTPATPGVGAWFTPGRFAGLLGLLIALTFLEVLTGQQTFFYRDFGVYTYPVAHYQRECFWRGEVPLWNPLNNCGIPFLAQWNTSVLYPLSLFYLVFPLSWSLGVFGLGHLILAGMGMYFLARHWTGNQLAAAVAGVAFAFNGLSWHMLVWVSNLAAWAWMPWVVLAVESAWRKGGGRPIALAALAGGVQLLTGSPEIIFLTWCVVGGLWLLDFWRGEEPRGRLLGRVLVVGLLAAGLAAAQLLPFLDLLQHSNRDAKFSDLGWAMPLSGPANFLVPLFRCFESGHGVFPQNEQYWTPSYYVGVGIVALALLAAGRVRERRVWLLSAAVIFSILMALGTQGYFYTGVKTVFPQLGFMRYPIKFVILALFALPMLAAYAVSWQLSFPADKDTLVRTNRVLVMVTGVLLGLIAAIVAVAGRYPKDWESWLVLWHNGAGRVGFLILSVGTLIALQRARESKRQILCGVGLLVILWVDVYTHTPKINPTVERSVYEPGLMRGQLNLATKAEFGEPRFMPTLAAMEKVRFTNLKEPAADYLCRRLSLYDDCNLLDGIPKTDGFFSLFLREPNEILSLLMAYDAKGEELKGLKDFLGIAYISAPVAAGGSGLEWTNRASFAPLISAGQKPLFADGAEAAAGLIKPEFDPRQTVYLPSVTKAQILATNQVQAKVFPGRSTAQRLEFEVDAEAAAMVTVAQSFYHTWHAYVDGRTVPLWRANHAFQALEVPAGRHQVKLVYEDRAFWLGTVISLLSLAACLVGLAFSAKRMPGTVFGSEIR
ncbi:MAG: hypothetical protein JWR69_4225 [Pedosphaera sp.]|nr:hypothetical protein [Pedosphaera sp.]